MALSTSTNAADFKLAINQLLYCIFKGYGLDFPFYQVTRVGGMSEADARTLRDAFFAYYKTRENSQNITPQYPDKPDKDVINLQGRTNPGGNDPLEDNSADNDETFQNGR